MDAMNSAKSLDNPVARHLGYRLRRLAGTAIALLSQRLATLDLTPTSASLLLLIQRNPGETQSALGRALGIQRANMVPLTDELERRGLIRREPGPGRTQALMATRSGSAMATRALRCMEEHQAAVFGALPAPMVDALMDALDALSPV